MIVYCLHNMSNQARPLGEQKIREFVAKNESNEHKPNTKKLC
jgi:hypothetical protein